MLNKTILPSSFLAPINYYSILFNVPNCIIDINEFYIKQTLRSRYAVYASNGKLNLSIPRIRKNSSKTLMKDIQICYSEPWQKIHWKTIISCYNSSPFFDFYRDKFEEIFQRKDKYLLDLNNHSLLLIKSILKIDNNINFSEKFQNDPKDIDLRNYKFISESINKYDQVFSSKHGYIDNLSIIDLIFNLGPEAVDYLNQFDRTKVI